MLHDIKVAAVDKPQQHRDSIAPTQPSQWWLQQSTALPVPVTAGRVHLFLKIMHITGQKMQPKNMSVTHLVNPPSCLVCSWVIMTNLVRVNSKSHLAPGSLQGLQGTLFSASKAHDLQQQVTVPAVL